MIGHQQIINARMDGLKPWAVFVEAGRSPLENSRFDDPEKAIGLGTYPTVFIPEDELRSRHDFRFLTGCRVHVHAESMTDDILSIIDAISLHSKHVIAFANGEIIQQKNGDFQAWNC